MAGPKSGSKSSKPFGDGNKLGSYSDLDVSYAALSTISHNQTKTQLERSRRVKTRKEELRGTWFLSSKT